MKKDYIKSIIFSAIMVSSFALTAFVIGNVNPVKDHSVDANQCIMSGKNHISTDIMSMTSNNDENQCYYIVNYEKVKSNSESVISSEDIGKFTYELIKTTGNWDNVQPYFPYMTPSQIKKVVDVYIEKSGNSKQANEDTAKYIGENAQTYSIKTLTRSAINKNALKIIKLTANWDYIKPLLPYMTSSGIKEVASLYTELTSNTDIKNDISNFINKVKSKYLTAKECIDKAGNIDFNKLSKLNKTEVDKLAILYIKRTEEFSYVYNLRQFMSTKGIDKAVSLYIKETHDYGMVGSMLQFMSKKNANRLAETYFKEANNNEYDWIYKPYLTDKSIS